MNSRFVKVLVILQLCLVFMLLSWYALYPFMGELYHFRLRLFLTHTVQGKMELLDYVPPKKTDSIQRKLAFNQASFQKLPAYQQVEIEKDARHYQAKLQTSWIDKIWSSFDIFLWRLPLIKKSWMIFTLLICLALLYELPGSAACVWLLPFLSLCYLLDNHFLASRNEPPDAYLFPTEERIMKENLSFQEGWENYLISHWSSKSYALREDQLCDAEFHFNLARLQALREDPSYQTATRFGSREPLSFLILYFAWNLFFAYTVNRRHEKSISPKHTLDSAHHST